MYISKLELVEAWEWLCKRWTKIPSFLLAASSFLFMLYQSWSWGVYFLKPIPVSEHQAVLWIPEGAVVANPSGRVDAKKMGVVVETPMMVQLPMEAFKRLRFDGDARTSVLVLADGQVHYRSEIRGFSFHATDRLAYQITARPFVEVVEVFLTKEYHPILRLGRDWCKSVVAYLIGFVVCNLGAFAITFVVTCVLTGVLQKVERRFQKVT